jgi:hypothetical protein
MSYEPNFDEELLKDEKILWKGQPDPNKNFTKKDYFLVPFSILWGGFAIFWEVMATWAIFFSNHGTNADSFALIFPIFGIPFVLIGLYFMFGRFIYKRKKKVKTWYLVTNLRVIEINYMGGKSVNSANIDTIPSYSKSIDHDGIGTLIFGSNNMISGMYANFGLDFFGSMYGTPAPAFHDIKNAETVYQLVQEEKRKSRS